MQAIATRMRGPLAWTPAALETSGPGSFAAFVAQVERF
jgi:hypothetical protein